MSDIKGLLKTVIEKNASDLHLKADSPPFMRVQRELVRINDDKFSAEQLRKIAETLMTPAQMDHFSRHSEIDFAYYEPGAGRFRTNIFMQRGTVSIVMRVVRTDIPTFESLNLPADKMEKVMSAKSGIIVICGPMGCGKSSTMAAMVDYLNTNRSANITCVEDPIEYIHSDKKGIVRQREVGIDTDSYENALRHIMRQDPDVIVIGEMRDAESLMAAMTAAEIGHLVLTTLHTISASLAISRVLDFFPLETRELVRRQFADVLDAVICQRLVPAVSGGGVVPAVEIMKGTLTVRKLIYENRLEKLSAAIDLGSEFGMQSFNRSFLNLVQSGTVAKEVALSHSLNPESLKLNLQGIFLDDSNRILDS
ncbi:type IV pilus twitching motility protein PilT [Candidatus Auribacterota bacterium]